MQYLPPNRTIRPIGEQEQRRIGRHLRKCTGQNAHLGSGSHIEQRQSAHRCSGRAALPHAGRRQPSSVERLNTCRRKLVSERFQENRFTFDQNQISFVYAPSQQRARKGARSCPQLENRSFADRDLGRHGTCQPLTGGHDRPHGTRISSPGVPESNGFGNTRTGLLQSVLARRVGRVEQPQCRNNGLGDKSGSGRSRHGSPGKMDAPRRSARARTRKSSLKCPGRIQAAQSSPGHIRPSPPGCHPAVPGHRGVASALQPRFILAG